MVDTDVVCREGVAHGNALAPPLLWERGLGGEVAGDDHNASLTTHLIGGFVSRGKRPWMAAVARQPITHPGSQQRQTRQQNGNWH